MSQAKPDDPINRSAPRVVLLATDRSQSIIGEIVDGQTKTIGYSAYGEQSAQQKVETRLGFNGQLREADIGWYLLGNGYRAYNPRLMRFHSPDSWSPFGGGGLNAYMYCVGDPVNRADPTGHWGVLALFSRAREIGTIGYVTSTIGTSVNLASLVASRGQLSLANGLGTISGMTGMAAGLATMFDFAPQASQLLSATSLITGTASAYLGIRSIRQSVRHAGWYEAPFRRPIGSPPDYFDLYHVPVASQLAQSTPPVYPLNLATKLPETTGVAPPAYSRQDPSLFSTPLLEAGTERHSPFAEPIGVNGTPSLRREARYRRELLDRTDGLTTSTAIRQRR
jgi:RHS repeat-associated protein